MRVKLKYTVYEGEIAASLLPSMRTLLTHSPYLHCSSDLCFAACTGTQQHWGLVKELLPSHTHKHTQTHTHARTRTHRHTLT
jgi:hypothetical protein